MQTSNKFNEKQLVKDLFLLFKRKNLDINSAKRFLAKKYKTDFLKNTELLKIYHKLVENKTLPNNNQFRQFLTTKPIRSLSGIINISVLAKPYPCPGKCIYCPREKGLPQSYLSGEPAVQRAILAKFDPARQVKNRLESLKKTGHPTDKIELRVIGGTWSYYPKKYKFWFIKECFRAANLSTENNSPFTKTSLERIKRELNREQRKNEKSNQKIVGITIETRPDYINREEIKEMRTLGITRVEIGVQSIYDKILSLNKRGHGVKETIEATALLKKNGFKVLYQMMLNLPGSNKILDYKMFRELFSNQDFMPDLLKIYPLALVRNAPVYRLYLLGKFKPYSKKELIELLIKIKQEIPYWCRIQRIIRDIPSKSILAGGAKISNLREIVQGEMKKKGISCHCIRCREIKEKKEGSVYLFKEEYPASGGKEIFLSFESRNRKKLYGILRLRIDPDNDHKFFRILNNAAIIREIHIYGKTIPTYNKSSGSIQHHGLGKKLMREAEKIAKRKGAKKIAVIAGVGTRNYYRKLGYQLKETYMVKSLS